MTPTTTKQTSHHIDLRSKDIQILIIDGYECILYGCPGEDHFFAQLEVSND